jgi:hypothetical protein
MIERTEQRFGIKPEWLVADTAYGSAENLGWLVEEKNIAPHNGKRWEREIFPFVRNFILAME